MRHGFRIHRLLQARRFAALPLRGLACVSGALLTLLLLAPASQAQDIARSYGGAPVWRAYVVESYPHDRSAFTQGLEMHQGRLYESTGQYGESSLRLLDIPSGSVTKKHELDDKLFGEGLTFVEGRIYQLTWRERVGYIYDPESFERLGSFFYDHDGWGIAYTGEQVIISDGTPTLHLYEPATMEKTGELEVISGAGPVYGINELEYINGELFANLLPTWSLVRIDPATGEVTGWVHIGDILKPELRNGEEDAMNGIAWDAERQLLYVTGKYWPRLFALELVPPD